MSSIFNSWQNSANTTTSTQNILSIGVESSGVESSGVESSGVESCDTNNILHNKSDSVSNQNNTSEQDSLVHYQHTELDDGSDYVLESDNSDSPEMNKSEIVKSETKKIRTQRKRTDKTLKKVSSTGNLRVYNKADLKNRIAAVEHRIVNTEKRLETIEKRLETIEKNNEKKYTPDYSIPTIIKIVGSCLLLLHIGKYSM